MISLPPAFLQRKHLDDYFASSVIAEDVLRLGLLRPFTVGHKLTLFSANDVVRAARTYHEEVLRAGSREALLRSRNLPLRRKASASTSA